MKLFSFLIVLVLFLRPVFVNAQWMQLKDSLLQTGDPKSVCNVPSGILAATESGIYFSDSGISWIHISPFYTQSTCILTDDKYQYALTDGAAIRSSDMFRHYDTLDINGVIPSTYDKLFRIGKRIIFTSSGRAYFSEDHGNSWTIGGNEDYDRSIFYNNVVFVNDSIAVCGIQQADYIDYDYYYSVDGIGFTKMFSYKSIANLSMTFHNGNFYFVYGLDIEEYLLKEKQLGYVTIIPSMKDTSTPTIQLTCQAISCFKGKWYLLYADVNVSAAVAVFCNSSPDLYKQWKRIYYGQASVAELGVKSFTSTSRLFWTNSGITVTVEDTVCQVQKSGIPARNPEVHPVSDDEVAVFSTYLDGLIISDNGNKRMRITNDSNFLRTELLKNIIANSLQGYKPFRRLISDHYSRGYYISEDNGINWRSFFVPLSGFIIIYYDDNRIIADCDKGLMESDDGAQTWFSINKNLVLGYRKRLIVNGDKVLALIKHSDSSLAAWYINSTKQAWQKLNDTVRYGELHLLNSTPFVTDQQLMGNHYYYLDTISNTWITAKTQGLPYSTAKATMIYTPDKVLAYLPGKGMYISTDLAETFTHDTGWPVTLTPSPYYAIAGHTLYISTNAGIWKNDNIPVKQGELFNFDLDTSLPFNVYPNPVTDRFTVTYNNKSYQQAVFQLYDMAGHICRTYSIGIPRGQAQVVLNREGLRKGMYILKITDSTAVRTTRLLLE